MKPENRLFKYSLFAAVLLVWGIIIFRLLNKAQASKGKKEVMTAFYAQKEISTSGSFSLLDNYPDPFIIDRDSINDVMSSKEKSDKTGIVNSVVTLPDFSFIKYSGSIASGAKKKKLAIIRFRNQDIILKEKNTIEGFKLVNIFKDSLIFTYKGQSISIRKSD